MGQRAYPTCPPCLSDGKNEGCRSTLAKATRAHFATCASSMRGEARFDLAHGLRFKAIAWHSAFSPGNTLVGPPQWFCPRLIGTSRLDLLAIRVQDMEIGPVLRSNRIEFLARASRQRARALRIQIAGLGLRDLSARRRPFDKRAGGGFSSRVRRSCRRRQDTLRGGDFCARREPLGIASRGN